MFSIRCCSERDKELIEKMKNLNFEEKLIEKKHLEYKIYHAFLYNTEEKRKNFVIKNFGPLKYVDGYEIFCFLFDNTSEMDKLIEKLKDNESFNSVVFFYIPTQNQLEDFSKFIRLFIRKLDENRINKVMFECSIQEFPYNFELLDYFNLNLFYNNLYLIQQYEYDEGVYLKKIKISSEYLSDIMKDYTDLYLKNVNDPRTIEMLKKYFINDKLLLLDNKLMRKEEDLLDGYEVNEIDFKFKNKKDGLESIQVMKYINFVFYFLKDSDILRNLILKSLNKNESANYILFREILEKLKIEFTDDHQILLLNSNNIKYIPKEENNETLYLVEEIRHKIRGINLKDDGESYKIFLNYFYNFLKDDGEIEIDDLILLIKEKIYDYDYTEQSEKIYNKLKEYSRSITKQLFPGSKNFVEEIKKKSFEQYESSIFDEL